MTKRLPCYFCFIGLSLLLAASCGERDEDFLPELDLMQQRGALNDHLVYIDKANDLAYMLEVTAEEPEPRADVVQLPRNPLLLQRRKGEGNNELLILCQGQQETEDEEQEEQPASLAVLNGKGEVRIYWLKACFNGLLQSDDGQYVFVFHQEGGAEVTSCGTTRLKQNVSIIDLDVKPAGEKGQPFIELTAWDESVPEAVFFSEPMRIAGQERQLAAVLTDSLVWFIDLSDKEARPVAFQPRIDQNTYPEQVLFSPDQPQIYVRAAGSDDVYIMDLVQRTDETKQNDFEITDTARAAGSGPTDLALYTDGVLPRLLVLSSGPTEAVVIDPDTSIETEVSETDGGATDAGAKDSSSWPVHVNLQAAADSILLFEGGDPENAAAVEPRALLYKQGSNAVAFLDLKAIELNGQENLQTIPLERAYDRLIVWDQDTVLLIDNDFGLSLLDLIKRTITVIGIEAPLSVIPDKNVRKLWLAPSGNKRLSYISLGTSEDDNELGTGDVLLDQDIDGVIPITSGSSKRIVVEHDSAVGFITVVDAREPEAKTAISLRGFFLADVLD